MSSKLPNDMEHLSRDCPYCHGTGTYIPVDAQCKPTGAPMEECAACWGAGTSDGYLNHDVILDLAHREQIVDGYTAPDFKD